MAITRQKKEELVALYKEQIENASALVFTNYRGTTVGQIQSLRTKLGEADTRYIVVKNTLLNRALAESGRTAPEELLEGPNAVAFVGEDIGRGVTALKDWIKSERIVEITGGLLDDALLNPTQTEALSDLPTKEQTLAMVLGAISAPSGGLVRMINGPGSSLVRVLNAYVEKQRDEAA